MNPTFETLRVWHEARHLTVAVYRASQGKVFVGDRAMKDQIRRAAISIMSNIAEGFERVGPREFLHFLSIAKGSAGEVRCQLYAAEDLGYLTSDVARDLRRKAATLSRQIASLAKKHEARSGLE
jgi:four helix bundle protein